MLSKKPFVVVAALSLAACAGVDHAGPEVSLPKAAQQSVATAVANQMKDPNSAELRNWHAFQSDKGLIVCGEVNSKNSYGGYVGFTHFVAHASPDGRLLTPPALSSASGGGPDPLIDSVWKQYYPGCYS
jgi:hypothetical protein